MRLLEICLVFLAGSQLLLSRGRQERKIAIVSFSLVVLMLVAAITGNVFRLPQGLVLLSTALGLGSHWIPKRYFSLVKWVEVGLIACVIVLLFVFQIPRLPKPTGPYQVGTNERVFSDPSRREPHSKNGVSPRRLLVQFWYPSDEGKKGDRRRYMDGVSDLLVDLAADTPWVSKAFVQHFGRIQTHAVRDVPVSSREEQYPVVIFSHGLGLSRESCTALAEDLASHGYIVVGIEHTYSAFKTVFPDGVVAEFDHPDFDTAQSPEKTLRSYRRILPSWTNDVQFVVSELSQIDFIDPEGLFTRRMNIPMTGMFGHSFGGSTTAQVCRLDGRVKAGVNLDGPLFGDTLRMGIDKPFLMMLADAVPPGPLELDEWGMSLEEWRAMDDTYRSGAIRAIKRNRKDAHLVMIKGARHMSFTDWPLFREIGWGLESGNLEPERVIEITRAYLVGFFDMTLKNKPVLLFDKNRAPFKEVELSANGG